jgi:preprotein translocase subunit SecY
VGAALQQAADKDSSALPIYALAFFVTTLGVVYVQEARRRLGPALPRAAPCQAALHRGRALPLSPPRAPVMAAAPSGRACSGAALVRWAGRGARNLNRAPAASARTARGLLHVCHRMPSAAPQAERKIPMNYAGRYRNSALARQSYLPFKVNATGVMPVIFSSTLLSLPTGLSRYVPALEPAAAALGPTGLLYLPARPPAQACRQLRIACGRTARGGTARGRFCMSLAHAAGQRVTCACARGRQTNVALIALFNYYYTFLQLEPKEMADQLKRSGASIPAVRPGRATADYITTTLNRMSILGSGFLAALAAAPPLVEAVTKLQVRARPGAPACCPVQHWHDRRARGARRSAALRARAS